MNFHNLGNPLTPRTGSEVEKRKGVAKGRAAERVRSWTEINVIRSVQGRMTTGAPQEFSNPPILER